MYTRARQRRACAVIPAIVLMVAISVIAGPTAHAAYTAQVPLGAARPFAVLAAAALTGNGTTVINGDVGWGTAFPFTGTVNGTTYGPTSSWQPAKDAMTAAYDDAYARPSTPIAAELGGTTHFAGAYHSLAAAAFAITTPVTLDAQNDPNAVFIFKTGPTAALDTTATVGNVLLINGAQACNVFWQVGGAATLGASTTFRGNILAFAAITAGAGTTIDGRAFSVTAAVTLDANTVGGCDTTAPTITAPADVVTTTGPGATLCSAVVADSLLTPTASDNSGSSPALTRSPAGNTFAVGDTTVTHTATDLAGNTAIAIQLVTVTDNTVPTIAAPADADYLFFADVPAASPSDATATDNCGAPTATFVETNNGGAGTVADPLIITRTFTATDAAGNDGSAVQTITVADTTPPPATPTPTPTVVPTPTPAPAPTAAPTATPTAAPTAEPTAAPTAEPTVAPTATPSVAPTPTPTLAPTATPTVAPTATPTVAPTMAPTATPTPTPTATPAPTPSPTSTPAPAPPPAVLATAQTISTLSAFPFDVVLEPIVTLTVGVTAAHIPVALVTVPRLPSTSTSNAYEPLQPVNFVQGFALGFALVLIGWLLLLESRKSA